MIKGVKRIQKGFKKDDFPEPQEPCIPITKQYGWSNFIIRLAKLSMKLVRLKKS